VLVALVVVSVVAFGAVALAERFDNQEFAKRTTVHIADGLLAPSTPAKPANFLMFGRDDTGNADTMMIVHVDPAVPTPLLVSFPRDLMVQIPGHGLRQLNSAYGIGGAALLIQTLESDFHIPIQHYLQVDFKTFPKIIDAIGRVVFVLDQTQRRRACFGDWSRRRRRDRLLRALAAFAVTQLRQAAFDQNQDFVARMCGVGAEPFEVVVDPADRVRERIEHGPIGRFARHQLVGDVPGAAPKLFGRLRERHHRKCASDGRQQRRHVREAIHVPLRGHVVDDRELHLFEAGARFAEHRDLRFADQTRAVGRTLQSAALLRDTGEVFVDL